VVFSAAPFPELTTGSRLKYRRRAIRRWAANFELNNTDLNKPLTIPRLG